MGWLIFCHLQTLEVGHRTSGSAAEATKAQSWETSLAEQDHHQDEIAIISECRQK